MNVQDYESFTSDIEALELQAQGENLEAFIYALPLDRVESVLEVGCGSGAFIRAVARVLGPEARVCGVDISEDHINYGQQIVQRDSLRNVSLVVGDVLDEGIADVVGRDFDLVLCRYVLMYMIPKSLEKACLSQMKRLARSGGKVVCIEPDVNFGQERFPSPPDKLSRILSHLVAYYSQHGLIEWRSGIQLYHHLRSAGIMDVEVKLVDGRIIQGGFPKQLVEHGSKDVERLLHPYLEYIGVPELVDEVAEQWREYLRSP